MKRFASPRVALFVLVLAAFGAVVVSAQRTPTAAAAMTTAATQWLDSLSAEQRKQATYPLESDEYLRWNFIPTEAFPRNGVRLKDMTDAQQKLAHALLRSGLSDRGYQTYTAIIALEDILRVVEGARAGGAPGGAAPPAGAPAAGAPGGARGGRGGGFVRDPGVYFFTVFGQPSATGNWGWRVEGHHISLRFTIVDGAARGYLSSTPMFLGTNPAEVRDGDKKGLRILAEEEDAARALVLALSPAQQQQAIVNAVAPNDIVTMNKNDITPLPDHGVPYATLNSAQRQQLMRLIEAYTSNMDADIAADRLAKINKAGLDRIRFAWAGETDRGKKHYYMVQGPTFLIEFDNTQNDGNHVHSVWRDFNGDFGRDLLREHVRQVAH